MTDVTGPTELQLAAIGEEALQHMLEHPGVSAELVQIVEHDPERWREICVETAERALSIAGEVLCR